MAIYSATHGDGLGRSDMDTVTAIWPHGHSAIWPYGSAVCLSPLLALLCCLLFFAAFPSLLLVLFGCLSFSAAVSFRRLSFSSINDFESYLGLSGAILWLSRVSLGSSRGHLVAILGHLGPILGHLGAISCSFSNSLERLGVKMRSKSTNIAVLMVLHGFEWPMITSSEKKCSQTL